MKQVVLFIAVGVLATAVGAQAAKTQVIQVGNLFFNPSSPTIQRGDTVKWVWSAGFHTTTSGTRGTAGAGSLWNEPIDPSNLTYSRVFNSDGSFPYFCDFHLGMSGTITVATLTDVLDDPQTSLSPSEMLGQNLPNPFNAETVIPYSLTNASHVSLAVLNILGQKVRTLVDEQQPQGSYLVNWDGRDEHGGELPSGIYFYRLAAGQAAMTRKLVVLR
ncbi:MAG: T9SS type A sorting domain-containing protein [candidate division Zixibacteria bacterium]|nr:T9SS type A sorting domain-containing protein [candidate division Zixibacteria bacterium]